MQKKKIQFHPQLGIFPQLQKRYISVIIVLFIIGVLSPRYLYAEFPEYLLPVITFLLFVALVMVLLYRNFRWQGIYKKLRPYVVTRILQILVTVFVMLVLALTVPHVVYFGAVGPYMVYWIMLLVLVYQFFDIFSFAGRAKEQDKTRCDFC